MVKMQRAELQSTVSSEGNDAEIDALVTEIIVQEKDAYTDQIIPFAAKEKQLRQQFSESLHRYKEKYFNGYQVLLDTCAVMRQKMPDAQNNFGSYIIDYKIFEKISPAEMDQKLQGDALPSEVLGISEDVLQELYRAAMYLVQHNEMTKAQDALYFLVTIAPNYPLFWMALGFCSGECHDYTLAGKACNTSIELDPSNAEAYVIYAQLLVRCRDISGAHAVLDRGLDYAKAHKQQAWAHNFTQILESEKKECI